MRISVEINGVETALTCVSSLVMAVFAFGMLLAAVLSALLVVADQVIDTWVDGHMLAAWVALWTVAFAALALLAPPLRKVSSGLATFMAVAVQSYKVRRMEEKMWEYAHHDPRIMAELQHAWLRSQSQI